MQLTLVIENKLGEGHVGAVFYVNLRLGDFNLAQQDASHHGRLPAFLQLTGFPQPTGPAAVPKSTDGSSGMQASRDFTTNFALQESSFKAHFP